MRLDIIDEGVSDAASNMERDFLLLQSLPSMQRPLLRFYRWQTPSITYGYFINPQQHFFPLSSSSRVQYAKRPTGGGAIFHGSDLTFSILIPSTHPQFTLNVLDSYRRINNATIQALCCIFPALSKELTLADQIEEKSDPLFARFCMAKPTQYDVLLKDKKILGAAQRRVKTSLLHQSSLFIAPPDWKEILPCLKDAETVYPRMLAQTSTLLGPAASKREILDCWKELKQQLIISIQQAISN